jgi:hypothetical protein
MRAAQVGWVRVGPNGHYECACYHPLFVFNQCDDLERCARLPKRQRSALRRHVHEVDARKEPVMTEFTFQATLLASIRVKAETRAEAEQKLRAALAASDANLGMLDDAPIVVPVEIEGDLDLIETMESTGEEPPRG